MTHALILPGLHALADHVHTSRARPAIGRHRFMLEVDGPTDHIEGLNLRLYNPQSRQWSLNFANSRGSTLSPPTIGKFKNGRGEFFSQETLNERAILVRFVISDITPDSCRFEQAFSDDGGKTWEVNWIAIDTRVEDETDKAH